ncbi:MAG: response regulator [Oligoflexia bacterium]|nr:response regulator [Oligoflexia bacterium]
MSEEFIDVFFLDDEKDIIDTLIDYEFNGFKLHFYQDPGKCLEDLSKIRPWIIVSDQRMPNMNGNEFLKQAKEILPLSIKIMLTGFTDEAVPADLINNGCADGFFKKPLDPSAFEKLLIKYRDIYVTENIVKRYKAVFGSSQNEEG